LLAIGLTACGGEQAPAARERIVSVAPNLTEMLFAAGAADQVVAVSAFSDYPEAAARLPQVGDAFRLDYERIVALAPTVAVVWETGTPAGVAERLEGLGIRVVSVPTRRLDDIAAGVIALGELAGTRPAAEAAAQDFRARISSLRERYRGRPAVRVFVQVDDAPLFTVGGTHLITEILGLCGGENVFADADAQALPVDLEAVLARAPEVILSTDTDAPAPYWARFPGLPAVARGNVYQSQGDLLARPSPRIADGAADVCARLDEARGKAGAQPPG
jgi:iron complex transport system substrate-binding protein